MYLIYIDESGKPSFKDPENYILSAVIVHEQNWNNINDEIYKLKKQIFPGDILNEVELHTTEILRASNDFKKLTKKKRYKLLVDIANLISNIGCTLISVAIIKENVKRKNRNSEWVESWAWRLLCERLERHLGELDPGDSISDYGLITMDSENPIADDAIRKRIRKFREDGDDHSSNFHLITDPYFVSSNNINLVQLADFVAWVVRRKLRSTNTKLDKLANNLFKIIRPKIITDEKGDIDGVGLKKFPTKEEMR